MQSHRLSTLLPVAGLGDVEKEKIASKTREDVSKANYIRKPRRKIPGGGFILAILSGSSVACLGFPRCGEGPKGHGGHSFSWVWPEVECWAPFEELRDFLFGSKFVSMFPISFNLDKLGLQRNKKGADVSVYIYIYTHNYICVAVYIILILLSLHYM